MVIPPMLIFIQNNDRYFNQFIIRYNSIQKQLFSLKSEYDYEDFIRWNRTLCSRKSDSRGPHQKVIALSIFGVESKYADNPMFSWETTILKFLKPLAHEINLLLPEWILRIYVDFTGSTKSQQKFFDQFSNIDICDIKHLPMFTSSLRSFLPAKMWRFLPIFDPYVDYLLSRDLDSPILQREIETIQIWLLDQQENHFFYIARDHIQHDVPILGGLWGASMKRARYKLFSIFQPMLIPSISRRFIKMRDVDQIFLSDYIWKFVKNNATIFDSYHCKKFNGQPYPSQRPISSNCFLGCIRPCCNNDTNNNGFQLKPCPTACRPTEHLEWIYC